MFNVGDRVTGTPDRTSHGWHGVIKSIKEPKLQADGSYTHRLYFVHWQEREEWSKDLPNWQKIRANPVLSARAEHLQQLT